MKSQYHVNVLDGPKWYRCRRVEFVGDDVIWELSRTGKYDLLAAYPQAPHMQLIRATDDESLRAFVRSWGPLRISLDAATGSDSLNRYRRERNLLHSWALLFEASQKNEGVREAVLHLLRLDPTLHAFWIRHRLSMDGALTSALDESAFGRIERATEEEFSDVWESLLGVFPVSPLDPSITVDRSGRRPQLVARPRFIGLMDALHWMLREDIAAQRPIKRCAEPSCGKFIVFLTEHSREFCSPEHAHRKAARKWAEKKREGKKKGKEKSHGTQKTR
jgi:hypothetical protein